MSKILNFELNSKDFKIKELLEGDFLQLQMYAISDAFPNNNRSYFEPEAMKAAIPTFFNKPILGNFSVNKGPMGDFKAHEDNGLHYDPELELTYFDYNSNDSEHILGMIRESDMVEFVYDKKTNLNWIKFSCCLWCAYAYKQIKSLLKYKKGKSSVSVEVEVLDSFYDENDIEHITSFKFLGCTILGEDVAPGISNAELTVSNFIMNEAFSKKERALKFAYSALDEYNKQVCDKNIVESPDNNLDSNIDTFSSEGVFSEGENENEVNELSKEESFVSEEDKNEEPVTDFNDDVKEGSENVINENPKEEISMIEKEVKEGGSTAMTYEQKRALLETWLGKHYSEIGEHSEDECACCCYVYVADLTDEFVYFGVDGEYYMAPYMINIEDGENESSVEVSLEEKVQVVRSWSVFSAEESGKTEIENETETFAEVTDPIDPNEEPDELNTNKSATELIDDATASIAAPSTVEGESIEEAMPKAEVDTALEVAANGEASPSEVAQEGFVEESVNEGPEGEKADVVTEAEPETEVEQPDDKAKGDFAAENVETESVAENVETEAVETEAVETEAEVCPDCGKNPCICHEGEETEACKCSEETETTETEACKCAEEDVCPVCGENPCVCEDNKENEACGDKQDEACGDKQDEACGDKQDEACGDKEEEVCKCSENVETEAAEVAEVETAEANFAETEHTETEPAETETSELEKFEFDGEMLTMVEIVEKYNAVKAERDNFVAEQKQREIDSFVKFGTDFVNAETDIDADTRAEFIKSITEKCNDYSLTSNEAVQEFAEEKIAMYYYKNRKNHNEAEFSCNIEQPVVMNENKPAKGLDDLKNKINTLKNSNN